MGNQASAVRQDELNDAELARVERVQEVDALYGPSGTSMGAPPGVVPIFSHTSPPVIPGMSSNAYDPSMQTYGSPYHPIQVPGTYHTPQAGGAYIPSGPAYPSRQGTYEYPYSAQPIVVSAPLEGPTIIRESRPRRHSRSPRRRHRSTGVVEVSPQRGRQYSRSISRSRSPRSRRRAHYEDRDHRRPTVVVVESPRRSRSPNSRHRYPTYDSGVIPEVIRHRPRSRSYSPRAPIQVGASPRHRSRSRSPTVIRVESPHAPQHDGGEPVQESQPPQVIRVGSDLDPSPVIIDQPLGQTQPTIITVDPAEAPEIIHIPRVDSPQPIIISPPPSQVPYPPPTIIHVGRSHRYSSPPPVIVRPRSLSRSSRHRSRSPPRIIRVRSRTPPSLRRRSSSPYRRPSRRSSRSRSRSPRRRRDSRSPRRRSRSRSITPSRRRHSRSPRRRSTSPYPKRRWSPSPPRPQQPTIIMQPPPPVSPPDLGARLGGGPPPTLSDIQSHILRQNILIGSLQDSINALLDDRAKTAYADYAPGASSQPFMRTQGATQHGYGRTDNYAPSQYQTPLPQSIPPYQQVPQTQQPYTYGATPFPPPGEGGAYANFVSAVGLQPTRAGIKIEDHWKPRFTLFALRVFRGRDRTVLVIEPQWDDAELLRRLNGSYEKLRTMWRKYFSLRSVGGLAMVHADHTFVFPRRLGPPLIKSKNMRFRYFLHHPEHMSGKREFMQALTSNPTVGVEFVERWHAQRIVIAVLLPVIASTVLGVVWSVLSGSVQDGFTIAGYMTSAMSVVLVLVGVLNFVEF